MSVDYVVTAEISNLHWLKLLILNVQNGDLTDGEFRQFVDNTLNMVQGYDRAKNELKAAGKKIPGEPEPSGGIRSSQFEDGAFESQSEWLGSK